MPNVPECSTLRSYSECVAAQVVWRNSCGTFPSSPVHYPETFTCRSISSPSPTAACRQWQRHRRPYQSHCFFRASGQRALSSRNFECLRGFGGSSLRIELEHRGMRRSRSLELWGLGGEKAMKSRAQWQLTDAKARGMQHKTDNVQQTACNMQHASSPSGALASAAHAIGSGACSNTTGLIPSSVGR